MNNAQLWSPDEFTRQLRRAGENNYHDRHPFHRLMNSGKLSPDRIRAWVTNRFCYQRAIPIKDAAILSNCPLHEVRRIWIHRIIDHDGREEGHGGIEAWLSLAAACGLKREEVLNETHVLPAVRFAVQAYENFARTQPWPLAIASSLTELFAAALMAERLSAFEKHYPWIESAGLAYFRNRVVQARADSSEGLQLTLCHCSTPELQRGAVAALRFKCDVLNSMLDAIAGKYCSRAELESAL